MLVVGADIIPILEAGRIVACAVIDGEEIVFEGTVGMEAFVVEEEFEVWAWEGRAAFAGCGAAVVPFGTFAAKAVDIDMEVEILGAGMVCRIGEGSG